MKLVINYDNVEYIDIFKKEYNKEKKSQTKKTVFCSLCIVFWLVSYLMHNSLRIYLIPLAYLLFFVSIIVAYSTPQNNFSECNLMSQSVYGKSLYLLSEWKRKLTNKKDNEIFTKKDNKEILVFDGNDYVSLKLLLKDFNYDGPVPETFDTLTITGKDGQVNISFS